MIITEKIEKYYKNRVKSIKNMKKGIDRDMAIGSLVADLGKRSIKPVAKAINSCFRKVKACYELFTDGYNQLKLEFRGRKKITDKYPNLKSDMEEVIENYKLVDSHFKTDTLTITITPNSIIEILEKKYNYPAKFACPNTIANILNEMGYKYHKIPKTQVQNKVPETDLIFENVHEELEDLQYTDETVVAISIDDKATKKIGNISDNGYTWLNDVKALDHDTCYVCNIKPFGILDLKTNATSVYCTPYSSTAQYKVDCIEKYIVDNYISQNKNITELRIFLDNGPENSSRRTAWLKAIVNLAKKYNIIIKLVYYPPYHSKYNKIERFWARLQMFWRNIIIDTTLLLVDTINKCTWNNVQTKGYLINKQYETKITVPFYEMEEINKYIIREDGIEKWSLVITPYAN